MDEMTAVFDEDTTPTEEATVETETVESDSAPQESNETEDVNTQTETDEQTGPSLRIRYQHNDIELGNEDAVKYAQMGKHYEDNVKSIMDELDYHASLQGQSVKEFVEGLRTAAEEKYKSELVQEFGADSPRVNELLELRRRQNNEAYEKATQARKTAEDNRQKEIDEKIAEDFDALRKEFPELGEFKDLPKSVKQAAFAGDDLMKAYLLYQHRENGKIKTEKQNQEKNKSESAGSVASPDIESGYNDAFMKGLWG